jgi:D-glycero-D-manno-heptose 1,7-bisphosphate phosphatase
MSTASSSSLSDSTRRLPIQWKGAPLRTIFLDRDGVINLKLPEGEYVSSSEQLFILPGIPETIARLNGAGLLVIIVTNQRGIAQGKYTNRTLAEIHQKMRDSIALLGGHLDGVFFCPHDEAQCECRKPLPGMFYKARAEFPEIEPRTSLIIGDSLSDIEFGSRLGLGTIFIQGGNRSHVAGADQAALLAQETFKSLPHAVDHLLGH